MKGGNLQQPVYKNTLFITKIQAGILVIVIYLKLKQKKLGLCK